MTITICYYSETGGSLPLVAAIAQEFAQREPEVTIIARGAEQLTELKARDAFAHQCAQADITILSLHGGLSSFTPWPLLKASIEAKRQAGEPTGWLHIQPTQGDEDALLAATEYGSGIEERIWPKLCALLHHGGLANLRALLVSLLALVRGENTPIPEPVSMPYQGIYHPDYGLFTSLASYLEARGVTLEPKAATTAPNVLSTAHTASAPGLDSPLTHDSGPSLQAPMPVVAIMYPRKFWIDRNSDIEDALIKSLEAKGAIAVPIFCYRWADTSYGGLAFADVIDLYCRVNGVLVIDAMIDTYGMSMTMIDPGLENALSSLDRPVLHAMTSYGSYADWANTAQGLGSMDVSVQAAGPEFDGEVIATFIGTRETSTCDALTGAVQPRRVPIPDRIDAMASQALGWAKLARTPNAEKKVAIIFHHHPPRADKIGCAYGLDSFESIRRLLVAMDNAGYQVGEPYAYGDAIAEELLEGLTGDQRFLDAEQMHERAKIHADLPMSQPWFDGLAHENQVDMQTHWGAFPGEVLVYDKTFAFAGMIRGNVYLTIQPPRGSFEAINDRSTHDDCLPPPHHYLAHYRYIRDVFQADAVIHVGTHGTLEWLPGKGLGLSNTCYPDVVLSHLPNIYPYIINNPGEGTQAKRRSAAVIVDHLTPPMRLSGLYDDLAAVDAVIGEYAQAKAVDPPRAQVIAERLWDVVVAADLDSDLAIDRDTALADSDQFVDQVNHYLMHINENLISDGLHVLGAIVSDGGKTLATTPLDPEVERQRVATYLTQLCRVPNGHVPALIESILEAWGTSADEVHANGTREVLGDGRLGKAVLEDAQAAAFALMDMVLTWEESGNLTPGQAKTDACDITKAVLGTFDAQVCTVVLFVLEEVLWRLRDTTKEIDAVMAALDSRFVLAGPSGAPTRGNALILPTGRNFYSIDPRTMPTPAAFEEGKTLADQLLARHAEANPDDPYPHNVGIIMWGSANMRTGGSDIAQVLYLYGVRPVWATNGQVCGLEIIGLEELGRPRIDVTPRVSGFFRDAFPNLVEWLDQAARMVAALDEPEDDNRIRAHVLVDVAALRAQGLSLDEAQRKATLRVFGCQPGTYGVGIEELIESGRWETKEDLANEFVASSAFAYGEGVYGDVEEALYRTRLSTMDVVTKNEDSREYDLLSCTDFYNEFGGLIAAATVVRGVAPEAYVGDMADPRRIQTRSTGDEARLVIRSRILNPAWITGLQRHGYKGAGDLSKVLDILIGWDALADVVDDALWSRVAAQYAFDPAMQAFFAEHNPHALYNITNKLIDAAQREIWSATPDEIERLHDLHDQVEGDIEALMDDADQTQAEPGGQPRTGGLDLSALGLGYPLGLTND